jgi:sensor histidine kinase regulating citrate/malate metabolism
MRIAVAIRADKLERYLQFIVEDNGPGWKGHASEFTAALRQGMRWSTKGPERGFGLLNTSRLARVLGGRLQTRQSPDTGGTIVDVLIPWVADEQA